MADSKPRHSIEPQGKDDEPVKYAVLCHYQDDMISDFGVVSAPVCLTIRVCDTLEEARDVISHVKYQRMITDITPQRIAIELGFEHNRPETWPQSLISMISQVIERVPPAERHDTMGLIVRTCQHFSRLERKGLIPDHNAELRKNYGEADNA